MNIFSGTCNLNRGWTGGGVAVMGETLGFKCRPSLLPDCMASLHLAGWSPVVELEMQRGDRGSAAGSICRPTRVCNERGVYYL